MKKQNNKSEKADVSPAHKGYNEHNPGQSQGTFSPDSVKTKKRLGNNRKEKPVVAERKLNDRRK